MSTQDQDPFRAYFGDERYEELVAAAELRYQELKAQYPNSEDKFSDDLLRGLSEADVGLVMPGELLFPELFADLDEDPDSPSSELS